MGDHARGYAEAALKPAPRAAVSPPVPTPDQIPLNTGRKRLVILGSGWAAARLTRDINVKLWDITVYHPFPFTGSSYASALELSTIRLAWP